MASLGYNIEFPIYKEDDSLSGLVLHKSVVDSVVMSLGDKISGDVYVDGDIDLTMREYILYKDVKYTLVNPPTKVREGMVSDNSDLRGMTKYSFEFYHPMYQLSNMPFTDVAVSDDEKQYKSQDKTFSWVGYLADYVAKLNKNLQYSEWVVILNDNVSEDKLAKMSDVLSFDKNTIADALKTCYDTWEVPFVIDQLHANEYHDEDDNDYYAQGKRFVILFGLPSNEILDTNGQPFVFKFGQGVGLKNNSATSKNNKIITRIAGYGSEDNIPYGYPQIEWTGNQSWEYTINNKSGMQDVVIDGKTIQAMSYPIYDGIVGGRYVKLIKHPFTRTHLMPSIYAVRVNKKVNPLADGYNPDIEIIDYYDADNDSFANQINLLAPSFEIHEFPDVKPELGEARIVDAYPYNEELAGAIPYSDYESEINTIINNESDNDEKSLLSAFRTWVSTKTSKTNPDHNPIDVVVGDVHYSVLSYEKYVSALYASDKHSLSYKVFIGDNDDSASWDDSMDMDGNYKQSYFKIQLPILSFDLYASAAITQKMDINMRSGACIGCTFPVQIDWEDYKKNFYDENGDFAPSGSQRDLTKYPNSQDTSIVVIVEKDLNTFGTLMPNIYQQPKANDQFVILGISLPTSYITTAEHKLDDDMITYMRENNVYYFDYPLKFDEYMLSQRTDILSQIRNNTVLRFELVEDEQIALYVKQITIKYGEKVLPQYDITLTDDVEIVLNKIGQVTEDVSRMRVQVSDIYKYYNRNFDQRFLRKDKSDSTNYKLTLGELEVLRSTTIGGDLNVNGTTNLNNTNISRGSNVSFGRDGDYIENEQGGRVSVDANGLVRAQVDYLQVNRKMTAKEVEIQEVTHLGGKVLYTAARMKCVKVEEVTAIIQQRRVVVGYKCYFENDDGEGQHIYNQFRVGDQAYCETWNLGGGTSSDFSNQFYWRLVTEVGEDYIVVSADDCAADSTIPRAGDDIVQLGYRKQSSDTDAEALARQGAIIQTAAQSVVDGNKISVPSIALFQGINSYELPTPFTLLSPNGSHISSTTIVLSSGETIEQVLGTGFNVYRSSQWNARNDREIIYPTPTGNAPDDPSVDWTTDELKEAHDGDIYLSRDGIAWQWKKVDNTYQWSMVTDAALLAYLQELMSKPNIYQGDTEPTNYRVGDIWVKPVVGDANRANEVFFCVSDYDGEYKSSDWQSPTDVARVYADSVVNTAKEALETQIDGKIDCWYQNTDPSTAWTTDEEKMLHVGDQWYKIQDGQSTLSYYRHNSTNNTFAWSEIRDKEALTAHTLAQTAQDTADGKRRVFTTTPTPPYDEGDLWCEGALGDIKICRQAKTSEQQYDVTDWQPASKYTDDSALLSFQRGEYAQYKQGVATQLGVYGSQIRAMVGMNLYKTVTQNYVNNHSALTFYVVKNNDFAEATTEERATYDIQKYELVSLVNEAGLVIESNLASLVAQAGFGTRAQISAGIVAANEYTNEKISEAKILADHVVIGQISGEDKTLNAVLTVQGDYVWAKNLAVEGFLNRGVAHIAINNLNTDACYKNEDPTQIAASDDAPAIQNTSYSLDLLMLPDIIEFTAETNPPEGAPSTTTFILPSVAMISGIMNDPSYIRPYTRYNSDGGVMTLAQMRALIGRKFIFINNTNTRLDFVAGVKVNEANYRPNDNSYSQITFDSTLGLHGNSLAAFELKSEALYNANAYAPYTEFLYWKQTKASDDGATPLNEFE